MNNFKKFIFFIFVVLLGVFITSCNDDTKLDELKKQGKIITVRYESNGGTYLDREGITLIDMFNPTDYQTDSQGAIHIKLTGPTDSSRPSSSEGIYITKTNSSLVGWYKNRTIKTNDAGNPIDKEGNELVVNNNKYYLKNNPEVEAEPVIEYSGYWNFETDTLDYQVGSGEYELTLYACWVEHFNFNYYVKNTNNEWEQIGQNSFDYVTTNQKDSKTSDKDTIWLPQYVDGALVYTHKYQNNSTYSFPSIEGKSFKKAYLDENMTQEITTSYEHPGYIDYEKGCTVNSNVNIYCEYEDGVRYYISTPEQFVNNLNLNGIYEIQNDLDFTGITWPTGLSVGTFNGTIYGKDGHNYAFKNITIKFANETAKKGGLFGTIDDNAVIKNVTFDNLTVDFSYIGMRNRNASFGLFAGYISSSANIEDVIVNGSLKLGGIALDASSSIYLVAGGDASKLTINKTIHLTIYGTERGEEYSYTINPETVTINNLDGQVTFTSVTSLKKTEAEVVIQ